MRLRTVPLAALLLLASPLAAQQPRALSDAELTALGGSLTGWLLGGRVDSVLAHVSQGLATDLEGAPGITQASRRLATEYGMEVDVLEERVTRFKGVPEYWRTVRFVGRPNQSWVWHWTFGADGRATAYELNQLSLGRDGQ